MGHNGLIVYLSKADPIGPKHTYLRSLITLNIHRARDLVMTPGTTEKTILESRVSQQTLRPNITTLPVHSGPA